MVSQSSTNFKFRITGVGMNSHPIAGSAKYNLGFVDSGTTFTYLPRELWMSIVYHFDFFCKEARKNGNTRQCPGERFLTKVSGDIIMCFKYNATRYQDDLMQFFLGYPILNFYAK